MFGWIHESIRQLIIRKHGDDTWDQILEIAKMEKGTENIIQHSYCDEDSFRLVSAVSQVVGMPVEDVWEGYGSFLIQFTMETGWDELLRAMSIDLHGFLNNLDNLHYFIDHVVYNTKLKGPSFRCEPHEDGTLTLHYYSKRNGLYPIVKGVVREVARRLFDTDLIMKLTERKQEEMDNGVLAEHVVFHISQMTGDPNHASRSLSSRSLRSLNTTVTTKFAEMQLDISYLTMNDFARAFPYHFCFDKNLYIEHIGHHIRRMCPFVTKRQTKLTDLCTIDHPDVPMSFDNFVSYINGVFVLQMKELDKAANTENVPPLAVKGQMALIADGQFMLFICSPNVQTVRALMDHKLHLGDLPMHDAVRDLILLNQSRLSQVELNKKLEETTNEAKSMAKIVEDEKNKTNALLRELLPQTVVDALRLGTTVEAGEFEECSIVFTDIVTFTQISSKCTPYDVVNMLNDLYSRFDRLVTLNNLYKVETIGDAYMAVCGAPEENCDHHELVLNTGLGMLWETRQVMKPNTDEPIQIRIGIHSGSVVGGVVGVKMPRYCFFGDTPIIANAMESKGVPSKIHVSFETYRLATTDGKNIFDFEERGYVEIKGQPKAIFTYFLRRNKAVSLWDLIDRKRGASNTLDGYEELHTIEAPAGEAASAALAANGTQGSLE